MARLMQFVSDGPKPYFAAIAEAMKAVPPEKAWRSGEASRQRQFSYRYHDDTEAVERSLERNPWEDDHRIQAGAKRLVASSLFNYAKSGIFTITDDGSGERWIARGPDYDRLKSDAT